jgi:hypothetical protein
LPAATACWHTPVHGNVRAFVCIDPVATLLLALRAKAKGGNLVVTALAPKAATEIKNPAAGTFGDAEGDHGRRSRLRQPAHANPLMLYRAMAR